MQASGYLMRDEDALELWVMLPIEMGHAAGKIVGILTKIQAVMCTGVQDRGAAGARADVRFMNRRAVYPALSCSGATSRGCAVSG